jgi:site-specific DNA-methyltransferase (adenine-specific)
MDKFKLYKGDCLDLFKNIEDKSVDMILCDLPYEVTKNKKDIKIPFEPLWENYERVIKDNGAIVLFAQGIFYVDLVNSNRNLFRYDIVWDKKLTTGFLNAKRMPLRQHEHIAVFYKKPPTYNPQFKKGKPLHSKGKSYKDKDPKNQNYGKFDSTDDSRAGSTDKYPTSIFSFQKPHPSVAVHRTEKPVDLLKELISTYTNPGDLVLDNTMGSGNTGVAALELDRRFIGIEMDLEYFDLAVERIKNINL